MKFKYGIMNIVSGLIKLLVITILGLVLPRLILVNYGSEVNGLMSSIVQLTTYLALLEVGVGTATLQALYKPISSNNRAEINSIMAATNTYYKKTGVIYGVIVILFSILYPIVVETEISSLTVTIFILISGVPGVINYFLQGKFKILLQAEGKSYIITNIGTLVSLSSNLVKIVLAMFSFNIIFLQASHLFFNLLQMIFIVWYIKKHYKWLNLKAKGNFNAISQKSSVMVHEISYMIFNHTDVMILTFFSGLKAVSVYTVYNLVFGVINSILNTFATGFQFLLGQQYSQSIEKYKKNYDAFELIFLLISFSFYATLYVFITPFIKLYTFGIDDANYLIDYLPTLFLSVHILTGIRTNFNQIIAVSGHFSNTKWITVAEAIINITISVLLVNFLGIYGVLIGTAIGLMFRNIYMITYTNLKILDRNPAISIKRITINVIVLILIKITLSNYFINIDSYFKMFLMAGLYSLVITVIYFLIGFITNFNTSKYVIILMKKKLLSLKKQNMKSDNNHNV